MINDHNLASIYKASLVSIKREEAAEQSPQQIQFTSYYDSSLEKIYEYI